MDIKEEIIEYIKTKEINGALLISGKWGCGKSYMIKKIVKEFNESKEYAIAIISLFGIDSIAALNDRVKAEYLEHNFSFLGKTAIKAYKLLGKVAKASSTVVSSAIPESAVASAISSGVSSVVSFNPLSFIAVKNTVGIKDNNRQFALIFDDFERCDIEHKDLLGAINEYVENKEIKTILVADEEKISNGSYSEFKEKLISRTLKLQPNFISIIESIIKHYNETQLGYINFLKRNKDTICQVFIESKSENLRSLKAYLIDFERIYAAWNKTSVSQDNIKAVFYMFGALTFGVKSGKYKEDKYGFLLSDNVLRDVHSDWNSRHILTSVRNWIVNGIWNETEFIEELEINYPENILTDDEKFLEYTFWDLEQQYITNGMPIAVQKANNGKLTRDELIDLLQKIFALKKYSIPFPCEVDYAKIESGFSQRKLEILSGNIQEPKCRRYVETDAIEEAALPLYKSIKNFENELILFSNKKKFKQYLNNQGDASSYSLKGLLIGDLDRNLANLFLAKYYNASNCLRREMIRTLIELGYTDNIFVTAQQRKTTIENLMFLSRKIKDYTTILTDYIAIAINNNFVDHLTELINKIESVNVVDTITVEE